MCPIPIGLLIAGAATSAIGTGASIASSIRSVKKQKKLMSYQDLINDENYRKQLEDQRKLIAEDRAYNDFGAVVRRARAAGVNPYVALGGTGGVGLSSSAGSTPSHDGVGIPAETNLPSVLQGASSSIGAEMRNFAFMRADLRIREAEAEKSEIEAKWKDKQFAQDYESKEIYKQMQTINLGDATQRARYTTAIADMAELNVEEFKELQPDRILSYKTSLGLSIEQLAQMKVNGEYQRDFIITELDKRNVEISAIKTGEIVDLMDANTNRLNANTNSYNAITLRKQYGLSEREFDALRDYRSELIRLHDEDQDLQERFRKQQDRHHKQNITKDYILGIGNILERRAEIKAQIQEKQQSAITHFGESVATTLIFKGIPLKL